MTTETQSTRAGDGNLPEPAGMKWRRKDTDSVGAYFEDPRKFGINMDHPEYEWTPLYTAEQMRAYARAAIAAAPAAAPAGYKLLEDGKTMIPESWTPLRLEWEPGYPEDVACGPVRAMERLKKWLDAYFVMIQQRMTPAAAPAWQPIETAPLDVLVWVSATKRMSGPCIAMHHSRDGWVVETPSEWASIYTPTHWMPFVPPAGPGEIPSPATAPAPPPPPDWLFEPRVDEATSFRSTDEGNL